MPILTFVTPTGRAIRLEAELGESLLHIALAHDVEGLPGDCGGSLACGTCHAYVAEDFLHLLAAPGSDEDALLDLAADRRSNSRLCCQIRLTQQLDGIVVHIPHREA